MYKFLVAALLVCSFNSASADLFVGTVTASKHFTGKAEDPNEMHGGVYFKYRGIAAGTFTNSHGDSSVFMAKQFHLNRRWSYSLGVVDGYEEDTDNYKGYLPLAFLTYKVKALTFSAIPDALVLGFEIPLK